jgi:hypothetical protein
MLAILPDLPTLPTGRSISHCDNAAYVTNMPFGRVSNKNKLFHRCREDSYPYAASFTSHPVEEIIRKARLNRILSILKPISVVLPAFDAVEESTLLSAISLLVGELVELPFENVVFERTPDNSLLTKAQLGALQVFIDIDFNPDELSGYEVQISAFEGQQSVISAAGPADFAFSRLKAVHGPTQFVYL